jgi:CPA1 family monovalent cation:H+ antiporter
MQFFEALLFLLVAAVALAALARRLQLPYPALLALGGSALALFPSMPAFTVDPQLTLALFVAPVLLDAAFDTSLRDLKRNWIPVSCLVVIAVGVSTFAVAFVVRMMEPAIAWSVAIALGAIVAPPDATAATAVLRQLDIPHRMLIVLEGESLLNDATALLIYRLAVSATIAATFSAATILQQALAMLLSIVAGIVLARLYMRLVRSLSDVPSAIVLQFASTFCVWILADRLGLSAIVTLVAYAITIARYGPSIIPARLRIPSYAVWETVVFVLNVLAFVLIGLQLRPILGSLEPVERVHYLRVAAIVLATVILVRFAWVLTYNRAAWLKSRWLGPGKWPGKDRPTLAGGAVVSWCGMRGIVTLAAAYALPARFPHRDLIVLCAFCVVVGTLVLQGLTLRALILSLRLSDDGSVDKEISLAHRELEQVAQNILDGDHSETAEVLRDEFMPGRAIENGTPASEARNQLRAKILAAQRDALVRMRTDARIGDDAFHAIEERLDRAEVNVA